MSSSDDHAPVNPDNPDCTFTRVVSKSFELDGVKFSWWAIDDSPALVTVSSKWFGGKADIADCEPEEFAKKLAAQLLRERKERAEAFAADQDDRPLDN
jgi:hypothetical protein